MSTENNDMGFSIDEPENETPKAAPQAPGQRPTTLGERLAQMRREQAERAKYTGETMVRDARGDARGGKDAAATNSARSDAHEEVKTSSPGLAAHEEVKTSSPSGNKTLYWVIAALLVVIIGLGVWFAIAHAQNEAEKEAARQELAEREADMITMQQDLAQAQLDEVEKTFSGIENPRNMIVNDSVKARLTEKYEKARLEIEKLQNELKKMRNAKAADAKEMANLRGQIETLRALLRQYLAEIDRLTKENEALRNENTEIKNTNAALQTQVQETSRKNEVLSERMTLAEKLNVTGLSLRALNAKGNNEKKVQKAKQLDITFTIPQNNSTPEGKKTIFARIITPEGQLLDGGGHFSFEGTSLACSAKKSIDYGGQEIGGIHIYYDVRSALNAGTYTVELFADNYRLASRQFTLK